MPAAASYAPVYDQSLAAKPRVVAAQADAPLLNAWYYQPYLPVAITAFGTWLMGDAGFTPPDTAPRRTVGQLWPRPRVKEPMWWTNSDGSLPAQAEIGDYVLNTTTGDVYKVAP